MATRQRPNLRTLLLVMLVFPLLVFGIIYNSDLNKISQARKTLALAQKYNHDRDHTQAWAQVDLSLNSLPAVTFLKSDFQSVIDQLIIEKAEAMLSLGMSDFSFVPLDKIQSMPAMTRAQEIKGILADLPLLAKAEDLAEAGKWFEAEEIFRKHLNDSKLALRYRMDFYQILMKQGRRTEARQVYDGGIAALDRPEKGLLELAIKDRDEYLPEKWADELKLLFSVHPDDIRLRLALANLESWRGNYAASLDMLEKIILKYPDDEPAIRAIMQNAMAANQPDRAWKIAELLKFTESEALSFAARVARFIDDKLTEFQLLEKSLKLNPQDQNSISRLTALAIILKKPDEAKKYQEMKRKVEVKFDDYYRKCLVAANSNTINAAVKVREAAELSQAAKELGLEFEAWAWGELANDRKLINKLRPAVSRKTISEWISPEIISKFHFEKDSTNAINDLNSSVIKFAEVQQKSGLAHFQHMLSQTNVQMIPPLSFAGGVGLIDFNNDGLEDVFAVQSGQFPPDPANPNTGDRLFQNIGSGKFEDINTKAGIDKLPRGFGHGVAVGDIDNDGFRDLFITRWRSYSLWRNRGDGTFEDVTSKYGLAGDRDWPTSAAFADLDNDGDLDLYVCHYMEWVEGKAYPCIDPRKPNSYDCRPRDFPAMKDHLFRNDGGKFTDVSDISGVTAMDTDGRGLGVIAVDVNDDSLVDLFVANDTTANFLFINRGKMQFEEAAFTSGVAANAQGGFQAGMGVAAGDLNGDGLVDLAVTNFYNESTSIFQNLGGGFFADRTAASGVAAASRNRLGFGIVFTDFDNNGFPDILTANGHVTDGRPAIPYRMPLQLFQNQLKFNHDGIAKKESQIFRDATQSAGEVFLRELMARGLVASDLDGDGLPDAVVQSQGDPLLHLKNQTESASHWIEIDLVGVKSNRDAVGAKVILKSGEHRQTFWQTGGGSFQSAPSRRLHVGLGEKQKVDLIEIQWPSGQQDSYKDLNSNKRYRMTEGSIVPEALK